MAREKRCMKACGKWKLFMTKFCVEKLNEEGRDYRGSFWAIKDLSEFSEDEEDDDDEHHASASGDEERVTGKEEENEGRAKVWFLCFR